VDAADRWGMTPLLLTARAGPLAMTRSSILWNALFAERYAALCSLQILIGGAALDERAMLVDAESALTTVSRIERGEIGLLVGGAMAGYMNAVLVDGPFRCGIMAAFLCFTRYRKEVLAYLEIAAGVRPVEAHAAIARFSIQERCFRAVDEEIDALVRQVGGASERPPWL